MKRLISTAAVALASTLAFADEAAPFLRKNTLTNGTLQLETCIRHYRPESGRGPDISLAGAIHIGTTNYFKRLQAHLDPQQLVLFEGVGRAGETNPAPAPATKTPAGKAAGLGSLQTDISRMIGCVFQLDAIDYGRTNFRNCDLSLEQITERLRGKPVDGDQLMQSLAFSAVFIKPLVAILSVLPESRALIKLAMVEILSEAGGDMEAIAGDTPGMKEILQVILHDRNETVFSALKTELGRTRPPATISLFYGAAHMPELAGRLERELHYRAIGEEWLPAFGVNPKKENISPEALRLMDSLLQTIKEIKKPKSRTAAGA